MAFHFPAAAYLSGREPWARQPEDTGVERRGEAVSPDKVMGVAGSCVESPGVPMPGCEKLSEPPSRWEPEGAMCHRHWGLKAKPSGSERQVLSQSPVP